MAKDTKTLLLKRAAKLFVRLGYEKTTMRMLAKAAGVQAPAIYNYFKSKKELLRNIDEEAWHKFRESVFDPVRHASDPEERIRLYIRAMIAYQFKLGETNLMIDSRVVMRINKDRKGHEREVFDFFRGTIEELARTRGLETRVNPTILTFSLFALVTNTYKWYKPQRIIGLEELANNVTTIFLYGLFGTTLPTKPIGTAE